MVRLLLNLAQGVPDMMDLLLSERRLHLLSKTSLNLEMYGLIS